jgi:hypothetical protein
VFRSVTLWSLVNGHQCSRGTDCLHLQDINWKSPFYPESWGSRFLYSIGYLSTKVHVAFQKSQLWEPSNLLNTGSLVFIANMVCHFLFALQSHTARTITARLLCLHELFNLQSHDGDTNPTPVLSSDEPWLHLNGYVNSQNNRYWSAENSLQIHEVP